MLAEHHCTHQLITTDASIAALLQIMHTAGQARTTSQTLDLDSARTAQQGRHSNGTPSTACLSDRGAGHMAASPAAGMAHQSHAVSDFMRHDEEDKGANAGVESACREEVCRQEQPEGTESSGSSAASAESISHSMDQSYQSNAGSHETGVLNGSSSASEPDQATAGACDGSQEVSSSLGSAGNAQRHDEGSMTESGADGGVDEIDSSSIHSRLLNAARAARTGTSGGAHAALLMLLLLQLHSCCCCCTYMLHVVSSDFACCILYLQILYVARCLHACEHAVSMLFSTAALWHHIFQTTYGEPIMLQGTLRHAQHHQTPEHVTAFSA